MTVLSWTAVAVFVAAYVLIATERIHRVAAALDGGVGGRVAVGAGGWSTLPPTWSRSHGMVRRVECGVWWARIYDYRAEMDPLLSTVEVERAGRLLRPEDRTRQVLGAVLLRLAVASRTGVPARAVVVDRICPRCAQPHGRPLLPGTGLHASITHSADLVGLALTRAAPVGLDVERVSDIDVEELSRSVLHPEERREPPDRPGFFTYWTRKEAVVKATGDGIGATLAEVRVTRPAETPALLSYPGHAHLPAYLADLRPAQGYRAALAVLTTAPVDVREHPASPLFRDPGLLSS